VAARLTTYIVTLIVATTFIAGLIVGAQREDGPVDVMVVNGRVYSADGKKTEAEAVAIQGNKILRVGTTRELQRLRRPQTVVIDAKGAAVMPGRIERDVDFLNSAANPDVDLLPQPTRQEQLKMLRAATKDAHRRGVTSVQTLVATRAELELFDALREKDALELRVYGGIAVNQPLDRQGINALADIREKYEDDPLFKAGHARIVVDDSGDSGFTAQNLATVVSELDKRGWQLTIHAIGDTALGLALDAYRRAIETNPAPSRGRRHFITAESDGPVDYSAFDKLGIVSSLPASRFAWASFDEHRKGELERDMLADLVVVADGTVMLTIFDGKVVFKKAVETDN
jgi:predicted amidohydrolase YtcJ